MGLMWNVFFKLKKDFFLKFILRLLACDDKTENKQTVLCISRLSCPKLELCLKEDLSALNILPLSESFGCYIPAETRPLPKFSWATHVQSLSSFTAHYSISLPVLFLSQHLLSEILSFIYAVMHVIFSLEHKPWEVRSSIFPSPTILQGA